MIVRKTAREIEKIAAAGRLVAETIAHVGMLVVPGVTTAELDDVAGAFLRERGGVPTSEGSKGYPAADRIPPAGETCRLCGSWHGPTGTHTGL